MRPARRSNRRAVLQLGGGNRCSSGALRDDLAALPRLARAATARSPNRWPCTCPRAACVASRNLGEPQRALLEYFAGIVTVREEIAPAHDCAAHCRLQVGRDGVESRPTRRWESSGKAAAAATIPNASCCSAGRPRPRPGSREIHRRSDDRGHARRRRQRRRVVPPREVCAARRPRRRRRRPRRQHLRGRRSQHQHADRLSLRAHPSRQARRERRGADQYGRGADDIVLRMPVGHRDHGRRDRRADRRSRRTTARALLAKGGKGGLGNLHFKSSTNRAPRQFDAGRGRRAARSSSSSSRCSPTSACSACPTPASRR